MKISYLKQTVTFNPELGQYSWDRFSTINLKDLLNIIHTLKGEQ